MFHCPYLESRSIERGKSRRRERSKSRRRERGKVLRRGSRWRERGDGEGGRKGVKKSKEKRVRQERDEVREERRLTPLLIRAPKKTLSVHQPASSVGRCCHECSEPLTEMDYIVNIFAFLHSASKWHFFYVTEINKHYINLRRLRNKVMTI